MMARPRLSVLIPTQGRRTLRNALVSITRREPAGGRGDHRLCRHARPAAPGRRGDRSRVRRRLPRARRRPSRLRPPTAQRCLPQSERLVGGRARRRRRIHAGRAQDRAEGLHVASDALSDPVPDYPASVGIAPACRFRSRSGGTGALVCGNVSGQSIVLPNDPSKLAAYPSHATGDFEFIRDVVENYGGIGRVAWRTEVICVCR